MPSPVFEHSESHGRRLRWLPSHPAPASPIFLLILGLCLAGPVVAPPAHGVSDDRAQGPSEVAGEVVGEEAAEVAEATGPDHWTVELMMKTRPVGDVSLTQDGDWVFYTVREALMDAGESEFRTQIFRAAADGSADHQLTFDPAGASLPKPSPDGSLLAFISSRAGRNIFLMRTDGGEAWQLTAVQTGVGNFTWADDSSHIVFTVAEGPSPDDIARQKEKNDGYEVGRLQGNAHLWIVPIPERAGKQGEARRLTEGQMHVDPVFQWGFDIAPDGKTVAFTRSNHPRVNDWPTADIMLVDVESGEMRPLAQSASAESDPHYSPDGRWIAFGISENPPSWAFTGDVVVVPADGSEEPKKLAPTGDRNLTHILGWSKDSQGVYFKEARGTLTRIAYLPLDGGPAVDVDTGDWVMDFAAWSSSGKMAFTGQSFFSPPEVYVLDTAGGEQPLQVSRVNADLPDLPLPKAELVRWKSTDGLEIEGVLVHPTARAGEGPAPLLLNIHGGPIGVFRQSYLANSYIHPIAELAAKGFAVLRPNIRGSSGYGRDFRHANMNDWGGKDYEDLMTGVDHVVKMGIGDPDRLGVMGWSYGGYMTSWIITQTQRFKAAAIGAPVTNLMSFSGTADIPDFVPSYLDGYFWQAPELYRDRSAMFHIQKAKTPSLILHGENDVRVPIGQSYELYNALSRLGVETQMVAYPRMSHGPAEPKHLLDIGRRHVEWFQRFLLDSENAE